MKLFALTICAFLALASADVSHLNNKYLPPQADHQHQEQPEAAQLVEQIFEAPEPTPVATPSPIEDKIVQHVAFAAKLAKEIKTAPKIEEVVAQVNATHAPEALPEAVEESAPLKQVFDTELFAAGSEYDIPALPEVSNGIDTRYAANGGYIY